MWRTIYHLDSQQIHCKPDVLLNLSARKQQETQMTERVVTRVCKTRERR